MNTPRETPFQTAAVSCIWNIADKVFNILPILAVHQIMPDALGDFFVLIIGGRCHVGGNGSQKVFHIFLVLIAKIAIPAPSARSFSTTLPEF